MRRRSSAIGCSVALLLALPTACDGGSGPTPGSSDLTPEVMASGDADGADIQAVDVVPRTGDLPPSGEDSGPECEPACAGKACGDDGCGETCGECGVGSSCLAFACVADGPPCPAEGTVGTEVGQKFLDLTLPDCDDDLVRYHDHCGADALLIFHYHGW